MTIDQNKTDFSTTDLKKLPTLSAQVLQPFSGSYPESDVMFLLQPLSIIPTPLAEKEQLIQSGQKHYSEMISVEHAPSLIHQQLYANALAQGAARMGREVQSLALALRDYTMGLLENGAMSSLQPLILVSFVRAGVPLGVLLKHALEDLNVPCLHYGVSIIRDKGIDQHALEYIIAKHGHAAIVFVDGWTGKGAISRELTHCLHDDVRFSKPLPLVTLADAGGYAWLTASNEDWLIPCGVLGSTVSGLISRTILTEHGWHGCMVYSHLHADDQTNGFIEMIDQLRREQNQTQVITPALWTEQQRAEQQQAATQVIDWISQAWQISNLNRIKPGIAEATRAILRRVPELVLLRDADDADTKLLRHLSEQAGAPMQVVGDRLGPYRAVTLIQKLGSA
jgi:hypothetical protein